jgi:hypothetical protein
MSEEVHEFTPAGRIKRPAYSKVAQWVKVAWDGVDIEKIKKSFKCCGISIAKDGTEDDMIFDYDLLNNENENSYDEVIEDNVYDNDIIDNYENSWN